MQSSQTGKRRWNTNDENKGYSNNRWSVEALAAAVG